MCDLSDPELRAAVEDIKNDGSDTNWILFGYEGKKTIALVATGTGTFFFRRFFFFFFFFFFFARRCKAGPRFRVSLAWQEIGVLLRGGYWVDRVAATDGYQQVNFF